jgi:hypothetical protein
MDVFRRTDLQSVPNNGRITNPSYTREFAIVSRTPLCPRAGHTLFEILLALGLSLVLLVAVYSALDIHWKFSAAGREQMERSQVARALLEKLHMDIRDVVFRDDADVSNNVGLIGNAERLLVQVSRPTGTRASSVAAPSSTALSTTVSNVKDQRFVFWQFVDNRVETFVPTTRAGQGDVSRPSSNAIGGLARFEADLSAAISIDGNIGERGSFDSANIIAAEVRGIRFRYFDGLAWLDAWDSVVMQRLPRAVEVTLHFRAPEFAGNELNNSQAVDDYRQVILVPLSEPIPVGGES